MVMIDSVFGWSSAWVLDELVITLTGELDGRAAGALAERLKAEVEDVPTERIVLDMAGVDFIDSSGAAFLVAAERLARRLDRAFVVRGLQGMPLRVLQVAGIAD